MTLKQIADAIYAMTPENQAQEAYVYPPVMCPGMQKVPITSLYVRNTPGGNETGIKEVVLLTGKPIK